MNRKSLLEREIQDASQRYYSDGSSPLSDSEFDEKLDELKSIDPKNSLVTSVGHGYDVSRSSSYGKKFEHRYGEVGSLDKVHNWDELSNDLKNVPVMISMKLDGISCVLYYDSGSLVQALSRGNGYVGIDITDKIKIIDPDVFNLSSEFSAFTGAVRGELVMSYDNFDVLRKQTPGAKNPRNSVAGLIGMKECDGDQLRLIDFVPYSILGSNTHFRDYHEVFTILPHMFNDKLHNEAFNRVEILEEPMFSEQMMEFRSQVPGYPCDGIVIAAMDLIYNKSEYQNISIINWKSEAFKFPAESEETTIRNIEWNVSKQGNLIPRLKFDTLILSGTSVTYATGFNAKYIKDNNLGVGSIVVITKSGEIIPYVVDIKNTVPNMCALPKSCPDCGEPVSWNGVHLQCTNPRCPSKYLWDLTIWMKTIAPIDGLSDKLIDIYSREYGIQKISDIYTKYSDIDKSKQCDKKQESLFIECLYGCVHNKINLPIAVRACNIPRFGGMNSIKIEPAHVLIMKYLNTEDKADITDNQGTFVQYIGCANYNSLVQNLGKLENLKFVLNNMITSPKEPEFSYIGNVCITGKLSVKRSEFEDELRRHRYNPVSSIKKDTMFLITDNPNSGSSKNKMADRYEVTKITESDFRSQYMK